MRLKLALIFVCAFSAIAVTGASAADFESDSGPCTETPGENALLRCTTGYVGMEYDVEIESEEGSGCEPYDWFEIKNGALPTGLSMSRDGVISGVPTGAGLTRFWVWNHDLTFAQGGPDWCEREDRSEREFSIPIDPGVAVVNPAVKPATVGQGYTDTLTAKQVVSLNSLTGPDVPAKWSLASGALPPGIGLSTSGVLSGTPTAEGEFGFEVMAQNGTPFGTKEYELTVRQPLSVKSPLRSVPRPSAEVGIRFGRSFTATGGSGTYTWAVVSGALPAGLALDATRGTITGTPQAAGSYQFAVIATDSEGRAGNVSAALTVAPRLAIKTSRVKPAELGHTYQAKLVRRGGVQPVTWRVVRGTLPPGINLSRKAGSLAGTPRRMGSFRVTLEARDALGAQSRTTLVLLVKA
jgi:large repetitive protein